MAVGGLTHHPQAFFAQALETVGRRPRLKSAATDNFGPAARHYFRRLFNLVAILDAARTGHHDHLIAAYFDAVYFNDGPAGPEMTACQFVRRYDAVAFLDAIHHLKLHRIEVANRPNSAQHRVHDAGRTMDNKTHRHQPIDYLLNLGLLGPFLHHNYH